MSKYIIEGGAKLSGTIRVSGNKNSVFPLLGAALLTNKSVILKNVPNISDTQVSIQILESLGVKFKWLGTETLALDAANINSSQLPKELTRKLRGSIVFVGALLGRLHQVSFIHPGGDVIGKRSIDYHLLGFKALGFKVKSQDLDYQVKAGKQINDAEFFLPEASVTATENLVLASVLKAGKTVLKNCAKEPHVQDLCRMLNKMGAKILGVGEATLTITGVKALKGVEFTLGPDYLEAGSYAIAAAITGGEITLENFSLIGLEPVIMPLEKMGIQFRVQGTGCSTSTALRVKVQGSKLVANQKLVTNFWPGFPTDMMSVCVVLATQARGVSLCHDWIFESRMFFVDKLISMGANITICDPHRVLVYGPSKLAGRELETPDIRAGMALVLASLVAKGQSTINRAELIERGYEDVVQKLVSLGANIQKQD